MMILGLWLAGPTVDCVVSLGEERGERREETGETRSVAWSLLVLFV